MLQKDYPGWISSTVALSMFLPLPNDRFRFTLKGNWKLDGVIGCFMFHFVNRLSYLNLNLLPFQPTSSHISLSSVEQSIMARDPVAVGLYVVVVSVWQEVVFRGFLLVCDSCEFGCVCFGAFQCAEAVTDGVPWSSFEFAIRKVKELVTFA